MNYYLLGKSGLRVSELCLGTMTFGEDWGWGSSKDESRAIYDKFLEEGGNFIDTANLYTNGTSEKLLGEFMQGHRERIVLATKYANANPNGDPNAAGNQRKNMMQAVEASLKRLKTDYIDLYWLHIWDFLTPVEEIMRAFDDLVRQGKILYCGVSDAPAWAIARANTMAELRGWSPFIGIQVEYSLAQRTPERELLPMARSLGIGITAWSPLAGGLLSGKYSKGAAENGGRLSDAGMQELSGLTESRLALARMVSEVAQRIGRSAPQVALAWLRQQPGHVIPIVGARKLSQFEDNLRSTDLILDQTNLERLNEASKIEMGFPHDFFETPMVKNFAYGGMRDRILA
jgi:aryl-alcohol dehydrogenase-like predicted oxidoreductase